MATNTKLPPFPKTSLAFAALLAAAPSWSIDHASTGCPGWVCGTGNGTSLDGLNPSAAAPNGMTLDGLHLLAPRPNGSNAVGLTVTCPHWVCGGSDGERRDGLHVPRAEPSHAGPSPRRVTLPSGEIVDLRQQPAPLR